MFNPPGVRDQKEQLHALILRTLLSLDPFYAHRVVRFYAINGDLCPASDLFDTQVSTSGILALLTAYSKLALVDEASRVFNGTPKGDFVMWNSMISAYGNCGFCYERLYLESLKKRFPSFMKLNLEGKKADSVLIASICCRWSDGKCRDWSWASWTCLSGIKRAVSKEMTNEFRIQPIADHYAHMVKLLGMDGKLEEAYNLFLSWWDDVRKSRDIVTNGKPRKMPGLSWIEGIITL
ncbi:hypothetical protein FEM48_Zijuj07G0046700 [Ziziphus jujuba var. spinosa]|uniref:Pentatricopeptide repeat-containing protein n=1 Tax=Ziziphus jujuba var. spinosa TaxID=714518 RepID=A0A978V2I0_ZIZJJ|nr:hypothetical protein FEM48_Zijuj07G0046700 [Ziziphus jujuba var. spinosa]